MDPAFKKIVILYASAGHGHKKAALAIREEAEKHGVATHAVDVLDKTRFGFGKNYSGFYYFLIRWVPWFWGFLYGVSDVKAVYFLIKPFRRLANHIFCKPLEDWLVAENPDLVIATHFLGSEVVDHLIRRKRLHSKLTTVITDYLPHWFWIASNTSVYAAASEATRDNLLKRGLPAEKIQVTGIPIESRFAHEVDAPSVRRSLGIAEKTFTILLTSGGAGIGLMAPLAEKIIHLPGPIHLLVVTGTNKKLKHRLENHFKDKPNVRVFGFVHNIHELMAASDLVVGKGGGLTITESLFSFKPMVLIGAVPGQETRNVRIMTKLGAAKLAKTVDQAVSHIMVFRRNPELYRFSVKVIGEIRKPDAASRTWSAITRE